MTSTIGDTIREIYAAALRDNADPVLWVRDYLSDKADRPVSRQYAAKMIEIHVIDYRRRESAYREYLAETPLGHAYDDMGDAEP